MSLADIFSAWSSKSTPLKEWKTKNVSKSIFEFFQWLGELKKDLELWRSLPYLVKFYSENIAYHCIYYLTKFHHLMIYDSRDMFKIYPTLSECWYPCADFEVGGMVRNTKDWIDQKLNNTLIENKKILKLSFKDYISKVLIFSGGNF